MSTPAHASYPTLPFGTVIRQPGAELISEPSGLASTIEVYRGDYVAMVTSAVLLLSTGGAIGRFYRAPHPNFPSLQAFGVKIKRGTGIIDGTLTIEYRGLDPALSYPPPPVYGTEVTTGNEPLMTHPKWTSDIAGTPDAPLNGAQFISYPPGPAGTGPFYNPAPKGGSAAFDPDTAVFNQWLNGSIFAGIEDYLVPATIFKASYTAYGLPALSSVGSFSNPNGPAPGLPANCQWFFVGANTEDNSGVYRIEASWKAVPSGDAASIIYG